MSNFEEGLRTRLAQIEQMLRHAKGVERRKLQKERADLEGKLAQVSA